MCRGKRKRVPSPAGQPSPQRHGWGHPGCVPGGQSTPQAVMAQGEGSLCGAGAPDIPPVFSSRCLSPLAQDDPELMVVQAGHGHVRQLKLLQLPHDCRETPAQQRLGAAGAPQTPASQDTSGEPAGSPHPGQGHRVQAHSSRSGAGCRADVALQLSWGSSTLYSQEKVPSLVSLTRKRLK